MSATAKPRRTPPATRANAPAQCPPAKVGLAGLVEILRRVAEQSARAAALQADVTRGLNILADRLAQTKPPTRPARKGAVQNA